MKKVWVLSAAAILFITTTNAMAAKGSLNKGVKTHKAYEADGRTKMKFEEDFPGAKAIDWKRVVNLDEARFSKDGQAMSAFYDEDAELVGTSTRKEFTDLPAKAQKLFTTKYKDYTVNGVIFFDDNEQNETDMVMYDQPFEDKDSYFVELSKGNDKIVEQVSMDGDVAYFKRLR